MMRRFRGVSILCCLGLLMVRISFAQEVPSEKGQAPIHDIGRSHIDANVPPGSDFDRILRRDLAAYFASDANPDPDVSYELLRDGPTQSGVAYPKFYAWVRVLQESQPTREGAVRLAAIERRQFEVLQFVERSEVERNPSGLDRMFPPPVVAAIKARAGAGTP